MYVDRTKCASLAVSRSLPIFKNWSGLLMQRERAEAATGSFGSLELLPRLAVEPVLNKKEVSFLIHFF